MTETRARISLHGEGAEVTIGDLTFLVEASTKPERKSFCPAELIVGALGS